MVVVIFQTVYQQNDNAKFIEAMKRMKEIYLTSDNI